MTITLLITSFCRTSTAAVLPVSLNLVKYIMMNAVYDKHPFSEKIISEVISYLSLRVGAKLSLTIKQKAQWHKFNFHEKYITSCIDI